MEDLKKILAILKELLQLLIKTIVKHKGVLIHLATNFIVTFLAALLAISMYMESQKPKMPPMPKPPGPIMSTINSWFHPQSVTPMPIAPPPMSYPPSPGTATLNIQNNGAVRMPVGPQPQQRQGMMPPTR